MGLWLFRYASQKFNIVSDQNWPTSIRFFLSSIELFIYFFFFFLCDICVFSAVFFSMQNWNKQSKTNNARAHTTMFSAQWQCEKGKQRVNFITWIEQRKNVRQFSSKFGTDNCKSCICKQAWTDHIIVIANCSERLFYFFIFGAPNFTKSIICLAKFVNNSKSHTK